MPAYLENVRSPGWTGSSRATTKMTRLTQSGEPSSVLLQRRTFSRVRPSPKSNVYMFHQAKVRKSLYPRRTSAVLIFVLGSAALLGVLQLLTPDRHPRS